MSRFNKYAQEANETAKEYFRKYNEAAQKLKEAENYVRSFEYDSYLRNKPSAEFEAMRSMAKADAEIKKHELLTAVRNLESSDLSKIRKELEKAIQQAYLIDLNDIDQKALEVLKSGAMRAADYDKMLSDSLDEGNHSMVKMIGKYLGDSAQERAEKHGENDPEVIYMRRLKNTCDLDDGREYLEAFSYIEDVFKRCSRNQAMIPYWDQLTAEIVEKF